MSRSTSTEPFTVGVRTQGRGTLEEPCLCTAWPLRLQYEVVPATGSGPGADPRVSILYGDRRINAWKIGRELVESGRLAEALSWPVTLAFEGYLEVGHVGGTFYLITDCEEDPEWIDIGPDIRFEEPALDGWLCPALFCYFDEAPERLYVRAEALVGEN